MKVLFPVFHSEKRKDTMKKISLCCSDADECISIFRKLAQDLADDSGFVKTMELSGELSGEISSYIRRKMISLAEVSENAAGLITKMKDECLKAEENAGIMIRQAVYEKNGNIIVEKTKEPLPAALVNGKSLKHDSAFASVVLKNKAGELK